MWNDISTYKVGTEVIAYHKEKKWVRFGRQFLGYNGWYYSGTNERSQWAQVQGDEPTHWMNMPELP